MHINLGRCLQTFPSRVCSINLGLNWAKSCIRRKPEGRRKSPAFSPSNFWEGNYLKRDRCPGRFHLERRWDSPSLRIQSVIGGQTSPPKLEPSALLGDTWSEALQVPSSSTGSCQLWGTATTWVRDSVSVMVLQDTQCKVTETIEGTWWHFHTSFLLPGTVFSSHLVYNPCFLKKL